MKRVIFFLIIILLSSKVFADQISGGNAPLKFREYDLIPSSYPTTLQFPNGSLSFSTVPTSTMSVTFVGSALGSGSTNYIWNTDLLQQATFYVLAGTATNFNTTTMTVAAIIWADGTIQISSPPVIDASAIYSAIYSTYNYLNFKNDSTSYINISASTQTKIGGLNIIGSVGIGKENPSTKLEILNGNVKVTTTTGNSGYCFQDGTCQYTSATTAILASLWESNGTDSIMPSIYTVYVDDNWEINVDGDLEPKP